jgi:hypothetical protein
MTGTKKTSSKGVANASHVKTAAGGYAALKRQADIELTSDTEHTATTPVADGPSETFVLNLKDQTLKHPKGSRKRFVISPEDQAVIHDLHAQSPGALSERLQTAVDGYDADVKALGKLTRDEQLATVTHADANVRAILVGSELDQDIQTALLNDEDWTIRAAMAKSPMSSAATLRAAYAQKNVVMHYALSRNPSTPRDILWNIVTNPNEEDSQRKSARGILLWRDALTANGEVYDPADGRPTVIRPEELTWMKNASLEWRGDRS